MSEEEIRQADGAVATGEIPEQQTVEPSSVEEANQVSNESPAQADSDANYHAIKEDLERKEMEIKELRQNIDFIQRSSQPQDKPKEPDEFGDLTDLDVITVQDFKRVLSSREKNYNESINEMQVATRFSDYREVISKQLPLLLKEKPHLRDSIESSQNKALAAYEMAKLYGATQQKEPEVKAKPKAQEAIQGDQVNQNDQPPHRLATNAAERIMDNANKPASSSQVGGQSAMNQADYYSGLSDSEFLKIAKRNLEGI